MIERITIARYTCSLCNRASSYSEMYVNSLPKGWVEQRGKYMGPGSGDYSVFYTCPDCSATLSGPDGDKERMLKKIQKLGLR